MKRFLRALLNWLDRKFPDKIVVTQHDYDSLILKIQDLHVKLNELNEKVNKLDQNVLNLNQAMGMTIPKIGMLER